MCHGIRYGLAGERGVRGMNEVLCEGVGEGRLAKGDGFVGRGEWSECVRGEVGEEKGQGNSGRREFTVCV